jgi:hypothetical protein
MDRSQRNQISNLLIILASGLLAACLIAGFFLYRFGPSGRYEFKSTLLAPELATGLVFNDTNSKTGGSSRYVFGGIEYDYYDLPSKQWKQVPVTMEQYAGFYQLVGNVESSPQTDPALFVGTPSKLVLFVHTESDAKWQEQKKTFQEVQFTDNYFRVQLRENNPGGNWAYFYHPGILSQAHSLFLTGAQ